MLAATVLLSLGMPLLASAGDGKDKSPPSASDQDDRYTSTLGQDVAPSAEDPSLFDGPPAKAGRRHAVTPLGLAAPTKDASFEAVTPVTNTTNHFSRTTGCRPC